MDKTYDIIQDTVAACQVMDGTEIEIRVPVAEVCFPVLRQQLHFEDDMVYNESTLCYMDGSDLRCIDGKWQRKRLVTRVPLPAARHMSLCVAVESPVAPPHVSKQWHQIVRKRWTYRLSSAWQLVFTCSKRCSNVEIEYTGDLRQLQSVARAQACRRERPRDVLGLSTVLDPVLACLSFVNYGSPIDWHGGTRVMPFICLRRRACPLPKVYVRQLCAQMQVCQPKSLSRTMVVPERPLVSLKLDGVRMVLHVAQAGVCAICRKGQTWHIPTMHITETMVLDCEFIAASRKFVVFDVYESHGKKLTQDYSSRLFTLQKLRLPKLYGATIEVKVVHPYCVLSDAWYENQCQEHQADGIVVHSGTSLLNGHAYLYKWKPVHTVDLYVGHSGDLCDGSYTPFLPACADHGCVLQKGEIWECAFTDDCKAVRPLCRRTDKYGANARHVCREIRNAHKDALQLMDVRALLQQAPAPKATRKRKQVSL